MNARIAGLVKWSALAVLLCAAVALLFLPFRTEDRGVALTPEMERVRLANTRLDAARRELMLEGLRFRSLGTLARWEEASRANVSRTVIDAAVTADQRAQIEKVAALEWERAVGSAQRAPAQLFITIDTSALELAAFGRPLRGGEHQYFALPATGDTRPCIALIRLARNTSALNSVTLGPCAFYARFGVPGDRIRAWLEAIGGRLAWRSDLTRDSERERRAPLLSLHPTPGACVVRGGEWCRDAAGLVERAVPFAQAKLGANDPLPGLIGSGIAPRDAVLWSPWFLNDLARDIGPERFAAFWTSADEPEAAFQKATGEPMAEWTRRWLTATVLPVGGGSPSLGVTDLAWFALGMTVLALIAVRARERVTTIG